jgi:hypothetical protein
MDTIPAEALQSGFLIDSIGAHGSRTMMLKELRLLLAASDGSTTYEGFQCLIVEDNVLLKRTLATRKESFRRLRELYALDDSTTLFRALRDLWQSDIDAQPLLALLCAVARDPILRAGAEMILSLKTGQSLTPQMIEQATEQTFPGRFNPTTLAGIGRHAASTWQQSGHLRGRAQKVRAHAASRPAALAYALFLGHLCGQRGESLFTTLWCRLLDAPTHILHDQAFAASQTGWIDYRHTGMVTEVGFSYLLREKA